MSSDNCTYIWVFIFQFFLDAFSIFKKILIFLERGKGGRKRERNIDVREHRLAAFCMCPDPGSNLHPRHVP